MLDSLTRDALELARHMGYMDALKGIDPRPEHAAVLTMGTMAREYYEFGYSDGLKEIET